MNHDVIRTWLGLPPGDWPPDHYTLLGLERGETDLARIEQRVHERLARLRCYQISHAEVATEAMNRLAQAFMCLTDPEAKRAYDAAFRPQPVVIATATLPPPVRRASVTPPASLPAALADTSVGS